MAGLIEKGHLHKMKASLPEISSVSWTNFMTGTNPGEHGIYGFTDLKPESYDLRFPSFQSVRTKTFWDTLGERGKRCVVINQPSTYPARKINGVLVSGFVAIELSKSIFPVSLEGPLKDMDYRIDIDTLKAREDHDYLWRELDATLVGRERALEYFWKEDWDFFELVVTGTDRLQHYLWNAYRDEGHKFHQKFLDYYNRVDRFLEKVITAFFESAGDEEGLYLLSDHGFTGIEQEVYLNAWLEEEGFLTFNRPVPESLADISSSSRAFAMDPNRIYLHQKGKFPRGSVEESDREALKEEIKRKVETLEFKGKKVVREVFDCSEIYSGPHAGKGPDLIVLSEYGFDMKGSIMKRDIFNRTDLQGMHTWDNAFFWAKRDFGRDLSISDLAGIILGNFS
jgi:predicted AlkP superfamily phosphohydrolase/phosphomutase